METQRVEAIRQRRTNETERRNLQQRTAKATKLGSYTAIRAVVAVIAHQENMTCRNFDGGHIVGIATTCINGVILCAIG